MTSLPIPGGVYLGDRRTRFTVWAPEFKTVAVQTTSRREEFELQGPDERGFFTGIAEGAIPGTRYTLRLGDQPPRPDPASRFQPEGVHGPSEVVDPAFSWSDASWKGLPLEDYVIYELHVGTLTPEGTLKGIVGQLDRLRKLGITAIEIMPVAQFPGARNWGYDGTFPFAVQNTYGGPHALRILVDECHRRGLAVVLDVVYNHLGPEGNYAWGTAPYFTDRYRTPWGPAVNFDGPMSDEVRHFFTENALYWLRDFHIDALRLDAVHAIIDVSARPFLRDLAERVHDLAKDQGRLVQLIAESDRNDPAFVLPPDQGGCGLDGVWNDEFHHVLHVLLTGENNGYYADFGSVAQLAKAWTDGFVYSGEYSKHRKRSHGSSSKAVPPRKLIAFSQNHDQIGNRREGDRLGTSVSLEKQKLAAGTVLLSPNVPLLFMGEEYGETAPFLYFTDHSDSALIEAVRKGRREEFSAFGWQEDVPDPQAESTFLRSRLNTKLLDRSAHRMLQEFHKRLLEIRNGLDRRERLDTGSVEVLPTGEAMIVHRPHESGWLLCILNYSDAPSNASLRARGGSWQRLLDSSDSYWHGPGSRVPEEVNLDAETRLSLNPTSIVLLKREGGRP